MREREKEGEKKGEKTQIYKSDGIGLNFQFQKVYCIQNMLDYPQQPKKKKKSRNGTENERLPVFLKRIGGGDIRSGTSITLLPIFQLYEYIFMKSTHLVSY